MKRTSSSFFPIALTLVWALAACSGSPVGGGGLPGATESLAGPAQTLAPTQALTAQPSVALAPSATPQPSSTPTTTSTPEPSPTSTETPTLTPTIEPTYVVLRGKVNVEHANCRYGPGAPYLYKYGLVGGSNLEIIRRLPTGKWIEIRAIGGNNPCWVKAELMDIQGDVMTVQPVAPEDVKLPFSPYYLTTLRGVSASRSGTEVTIAWSPFQLRPGDDSEQFPYLIETWVCQGGELVFNPIGTYDTATTVTDEPGCAEPSHARAYAVEKHGYTQWVEVPWPAN